MGNNQTVIAATPGANGEMTESEKHTILAQVLLTGELGRLTPDQKVAYCRMRAEQIGLSLLSNPFSILRLQGKEVLYLTRSATDQLSAMHKLSRETLEGPDVRDFDGQKCVYCKVIARSPDGRAETATATIFFTRLDEQLLMKVETKAKRRVTISILGLGFSEDSDGEPAPAPVRLRRGASDQSEHRVDRSSAGDAMASAQVIEAARRDLDELPNMLSCNAAIAAWHDHSRNLADLADRKIIQGLVEDKTVQWDRAAFKARVIDAEETRLDPSSGTQSPSRIVSHRTKIHRAGTLDELDDVFAAVPEDILAALLDDARRRAIALCSCAEEIDLQVSRFARIKGDGRARFWILALEQRRDELKAAMPKHLGEALLVFSSGHWRDHLLRSVTTSVGVAGSLEKRRSLFSEYGVWAERYSTAVERTLQFYLENRGSQSDVLTLDEARVRLDANLHMVATAKKQKMERPSPDAQ